MPYQYVEFKINPPIKESLGKVPSDIKLLEENGTITGLQVSLGEEPVEEIKKSIHFKEILDESEKKREHSDNPEKEQNLKSKNYINQLEQELRDYGTQKARNFINQLNFRLNSSTYDVHLTTLAILVLQRHLSYGASGYIKSDLKTDIYEIKDEDNFLNRILNNYNNGLKAYKYGDFVSAYKFFYLTFPEGHNIAGNDDQNITLKLLRDGTSHIELNNKKLMIKAKELLGEEYVGTDADGKVYAFIDQTIERHKNLFIKYIPVVQRYSKEYIDNYIQIHT
ncbi:hypothetical protein [Methanothrix soehngenii]|jgi:hypothetical protein|uniref:hypothetical protein n=1 Tax=Methanothrix soehngenii TaxID=2223 RepID=UPI002357EA3C|nr:hypothetical protein [Methanothrix soehngenii]